VWLGLIAAAAAGDLYINDTRVDPASVAGVVLENVDVTFDSAGNTRIDAPGYKIKVVDRPRNTAEARGAKRAAPGVPLATWWLVTQDLDSSGHTVDVYINDRKALTVGSGGEQVIRDLAEFLKPGTNRIVLRSRSVDAGGGAFYVFVGTGEDEGGTVKIDKPDVEFGLGTANQKPVEREFTIEVR